VLKKGLGKGIQGKEGVQKSLGSLSTKESLDGGVNKGSTVLSRRKVNRKGGTRMRTHSSGERGRECLQGESFGQKDISPWFLWKREGIGWGDWREIRERK